MSRRLVLLGGGHAHTATLAQIPALTGSGYEVVVVSPSPLFYYSGMAPGAFGGRYAAEEIRCDIRSIVQGGGGRFVEARAERIDRDSKQVVLSGGETLGYDVLSCNVGSEVTSTIPEISAADNVFTVKPVERLLAARELLISLLERAETLAGGAERREPVRCVVVGGGAGAVEIAGNAWNIAQERFGAAGQSRLHIRLVAAEGLLPTFPKRLRLGVARQLRRRGVALNSSRRVSAVHSGEVHMESGEAVPANLVLLATGIKPPALFRDSGLSVAADGGLVVNEQLQSVDAPEIFAGGDCLAFGPRELDRVGVYAIRQGPVLQHNLKAALTENDAELNAFDPGGRYLLALNMGNGTGYATKHGVVIGGPLALKLKEFFDKSFIRRCQSLDRSREPITL